MKKFFSILIGASLLVGVSSCNNSDDDSFIDPSFKGPTYFTLTTPDTTFTKTQNFQAFLDENGEFQLYIDDLMFGQFFDMKILKFQQGNFPTNVNTIDYTYQSGDLSFDFFTSTDIQDPRRNNGMIKITKIDREDMLVSGSFNTLLMPSPLNQFLNRSFKVSGEFKNVPYTRIGTNETGFIYATLDGTNIKDLDVISNPLGDVVNKKIVIKAKSKTMRKRAMTITFDKDLAKGNYGYEQIQAQYTSENGVVYYSNDKDKELTGSYFKLEDISALSGQNTRIYSGKFTFKMKSKEGDIITLQFGDFKATLSMKEIISIPNPDPGTGIPEL